MGNSNNVYRHVVGVAGGFFRILLYICAVLFILWVGKSAYSFGYQVFNQQAMSPGEGQEVTVVIKKDASVYQIGKTLEKKGLIEDAKVFVVQEKLSNYKGKLKPGTYILSTAYTPDRIMQVLSGAEDEEESQ
ncbi:MAG: endolytic transglycosylase MltG [Blautia sp.]|jgi:UPF0755 protein